MSSAGQTAAEENSPRRGWLVFLAGCLLLTMVFAGLGIWQVQRLYWKLDLIERVEARVSAQPVPAPTPPDWPTVNAESAEYRHVELSGRYLDAPETLTMAVTERGPGFWVLAPFHTTSGFTILVNRGFVPDQQRAPEDRRPAGDAETRVIGLLRLTEPGGGFLRSNDPQADRWYSRDVAAIAASRSLGQVAPYFVDADAASEPGPLPQGGMTQINFRNSHLVYALTWFCLALMSAAAGVYLVRTRRAASV